MNKIKIYLKSSPRIMSQMKKLKKYKKLTQTNHKKVKIN